MQRHARLAAIALLATACRTSETPSADPAMDATPRPPVVGYAPVNGLALYYEDHGAGGVPLVLLHGGGDTIETSFGRILPELARTRRVIAFEQQGYGHTADVAERPFTFAQSADDTVALLDHLGIEQADLFGFSNGGTIALEVALRHPTRVRRLVLAAALASRDGAPAWFWEFIERATFDDMPQHLKDAYLAVAPQPQNLRLFHDKAAARMRGFEDLSLEAIGAIESPALVVIGDRDVVLPEHAAELARLIPGSQLAVLPATDHMQLTSRVESLVPMIESFLARR